MAELRCLCTARPAAVGSAYAAVLRLLGAILKFSIEGRLHRYKGGGVGPKN